MNRPIYACDRCGHWYTLDKQFEHMDLPYEPRAVGGRGVSKWDLCEVCNDSFDDLLRKHADCDDYEAQKAHWFAAGRGAEVKPMRALRR